LVIWLRLFLSVVVCVYAGVPVHVKYKLCNLAYFTFWLLQRVLVYIMVMQLNFTQGDAVLLFTGSEVMIVSKLFKCKKLVNQLHSSEKYQSIYGLV